MDDPDLDQLEDKLRSQGRGAAVAEVVLGATSFGIAWALHVGAFEQQLLSKHARWFVIGACVLGAIFLLGGLRGLLRRSP